MKSMCGLIGFSGFSAYIVTIYDMRIDKAIEIDCLLRNFLAQRRFMIHLDILLISELCDVSKQVYGQSSHLKLSSSSVSFRLFDVSF